MNNKQKRGCVISLKRKKDETEIEKQTPHTNSVYKTISVKKTK